jgi:hypothetical protein
MEVWNAADKKLRQRMRTGITKESFKTDKAHSNQLEKRKKTLTTLSNDQ